MTTTAATRSKRAATRTKIDEPVGQWAAKLAEVKLVVPYQVTANITISVPDTDRAQEIRNADMVLSLLRLKLAELLIEKAQEAAEAQALNVIRDKLEQNPGNLTSQELSTLTTAIMNRRRGVPNDLFDQVAAVSKAANERLERAVLGDQYDAVNKYLAGQDYNLYEELVADAKANLLPLKHLPADGPKGDESSTTSNTSGTT